MQFNTSNPLRLNKQDAARLPRSFLILIALLYVIPGLTWRELWRQEAGSFGVMLTMANGAIRDWLLPNVAGMPAVDLGPLPYWIGALFIKIFGHIISPFHAAQMGIALQDLISMSLLWNAIYRLGTREELQPQRLAFGGEPSAKSYARMLADSGVLLMIATYGVAAHTHDVSEGATVLLSLLLWLNGAVACLESPQTGRWKWMAGLVALGLTLPVLLFVFFIAITMGVMFSTHWRENSLQIAPVVLLFGLGVTFAWYYNLSMASDYFELWARHQHFAPLARDDLSFFARNVLVFNWPVWPLALWCIWQWKRQWQTPMMVLGLAMMLAPLLHLFIVGQRFDESMLFFLPSLLLLAPFGLATLNRGRANIIDWFSLLTFSTVALAIWVMWITAWTHHPAQLAENIFKLAPGFEMSFKWWPFVIAVATTLGWFAVLRWRLIAQPQAIWKSVVISSSGLVLVWVLLATLTMPWLDYTRSYEDTGKSLAAQLPVQGSCIHGQDLPLTARGAMMYYANAQFAPNLDTFAEVRCPYVLTNLNNLSKTAEIDMNRANSFIIRERSWTIVWSGERLTERKNPLVLLRQN